MAPEEEAHRRLAAPFSWAIFITVTALLSFVLLIVLQVACDPIGLGGDCPPWVPPALLATNTLEESRPEPQGAAGGFAGYGGFTAEAMNATRHGSLAYVGPQTPSTGPLIISVNPIDRFRWAAAAKSQQNGRCYLILITADRNNPTESREERDGIARPGTPCRGSLATPQTVTLQDWPYVPSRQEPWATMGFAVAAGAAALVAVSKLARGRLGKIPSWLLYALGVVLAVAGIWTSAATIA